MLNKSTTIRSVISTLLIMVFAVSITPVVILHQLAANHKDVSYADNNQKTAQYAKAGIHCHCMDFVAEAQFLHFFTPFDFTVLKSFPLLNGRYKKSFYTSDHFYAKLRGPPAIA